MALSCPHCSQELGSGFATQDALEARLSRQKEKYAAEIDALKTQLGDAQTKAEDAEPLRSQLEELRGKVAAAEQGQALASIGLDERYHQAAVTLWQAHSAAEDEDERLGIREWLEGPAREEGSVLAAVLPAAVEAGDESAGTGTQQAGAASGAQQQRGAFGLPRGTTGTHASPPRGQQKRRTPAEVRAILQSPDFLALPKDERSRRRLALREELIGS